MRRWCTLPFVLVAACRGQGREIMQKRGAADLGVPEQKELGTVPYLGHAAIGQYVGDGKLAGPETVVHDLEQDVYFVSNINGNPNERDDNGYISKISPSGEVIEQYFIDGREPDIELHAPRGMIIGGDTLYVADEGGIRLFDRKSGDPLGFWPVPDDHFLNALAIDPKGRVLATETGIDLLPTGPQKTGAYKIYAFDADGHPTVLAQGDDLHGPNGIVAGPAGIFVIEFMDDEHGVYKLDDSGAKHLLGTLPFGELDGIAQLPDGTFLVSSWFANGIYRFVPGEPPTLAIEHLVAPAGISYDVLRNRVLIPEVLGNTLRIEPWAPPSAKLLPMEDRWGAR